MTSLHGYLMWLLAGIGLAAVMLIELLASWMENCLAVSTRDEPLPAAPQMVPVETKIMSADDLMMSNGALLGREGNGSSSSHSSWLSSTLGETAHHPAQPFPTSVAAGSTGGCESDPAGGWFGSDVSSHSTSWSGSIS
jgi:hypothetical protein